MSISTSTMHDIPKIDLFAVVATIIREHFNGNISTIERLGTGSFPTFSVQASGRSVPTKSPMIIKLFRAPFEPDDGPHRWKLETNAQEIIRDAKNPFLLDRIPQMLSKGVSLGIPFVIYAHANGTPLYQVESHFSIGQRRELTRTLATFLAHLHRLKIPCGEAADSLVISSAAHFIEENFRLLATNMRGADVISGTNYSSIWGTLNHDALT